MAAIEILPRGARSQICRSVLTTPVVNLHPPLDDKWKTCWDRLCWSCATNWPYRLRTASAAMGEVGQRARTKRGERRELARLEDKRRCVTARWTFLARTRLHFPTASIGMSPPMKTKGRVKSSEMYTPQKHANLPPPSRRRTVGRRAQS